MEDQTEFIQQSSLPQQPNIKSQTPPEHKQHSFLTSRLFPITLLILIAFILGYAGIYLSLNSRLNQMAKPNPTPVTLPSVSPAASDAVGANWKTYRNDEFGFEVKYPKEAQLTREVRTYTTKVGTIEIEPLMIDLSSTIVEKGTNLSSKNFVVSIHDPASSNICANTERYLSQAPNVERVTVNGIEFRKYISPTGGTQTKAYYINYFVLKGDKCFELVFGLSGSRYSPSAEFNPIKESAIFDQILSTFKFLDQTQVVPTTNPEGKFCGGIAANLPENQCQLGYKCQLDGKYPDAGGKCVKQ